MSNYDNSDPYYSNKVIKETILKGTRKAIATNLLDSYRNKIHAGVSRYIEVEKLILFKNKIGKGSMIDHFYRAVVLSLCQKRELNATYDGNVYKIYKNVNLSIAVNTPKGLVTPVLKKAENLSMGQFINNRKEIISIALRWKQKYSDISGGTFTVSNLGNYGIDFLSPIINPPQIAIMGVSRMCSLNISWDSSKVNKIKQLIPINITFDHRIIDGVLVAEFLQSLQDIVNKPEDLWN